MQLTKLAVLGNVCFWITLVFQFWKPARIMQEDLLNTIVMIGLLSILFNGVWMIWFLVNDKPGRVFKQGGDSPEQSGSDLNRMQGFLFTSFNSLSFAAQLIFLYLNYL